MVDAEITQARLRRERLGAEADRIARQREALSSDNPQSAVAKARASVDKAQAKLQRLRSAIEDKQARKEDLQARRDEAASAYSAAKADLSGVQREYDALKRDRDGRERAAAKRSGRQQAIDAIRAEKGYERALAAALGRDGKAVLGQPEANSDGRYWTGAASPSQVADSLADHVTRCPDELVALLALVHVAQDDDGRTLGPGETLVTREGVLRRWDGLVVRGEGAAEAARLEAENRFAELDALVPDLQKAVADAEAEQREAASAMSDLQRDLVAAERDLANAAEAERGALRALDQAEAAKERHAARLAELGVAESQHAEAVERADAELAAAEARREELPDPAAGRASLETARNRNEAARATLQARAAELAAHDQSLAVARERTAAQRKDMANWQARSGEAARRLSDMARRFEEIEEDRAVHAAKPEGLMREIEQGDTVRERLAAGLAEAESALAAATQTARAAEQALSEASEALATAREERAGLAAQAEHQDGRRVEMARLSGERFQSPPPLLPDRFAFEESDVVAAEEEGEAMERLTASRERIGPVNLVAADELAKIEEEHGTNAAEQEELREAVNRLRGSIGNLNREGRERLREAFEQVNGHFKRLFTRLFEGGEAHLALIDSDDPLEAGLEIFAQPPGKRLQSLTLLSGGEQALTATALIFGLFLTNPAPICVLDEVDAPLDDANIDRFCDLLEAMVRETDTRYLIVTHNAVTMSRMHRLFGVTMIEKGVSRLVSVDLGEAERMAAE